MRPAGPDLGRRVDEIRRAHRGRGRWRARGLRPDDADPERVARHRRDPSRVDDGARPHRDPAESSERTRVTGARTVSSALASASVTDADEYAGYLVVDGELRELPNGSSFDPSRGAFYWQPGLGYVGNYDLLFVRTGADGARERIPVRVTLQDRRRRRWRRGCRDRGRASASIADSRLRPHLFLSFISGARSEHSSRVSGRSRFGGRSVYHGRHRVPDPCKPCRPRA